MLLLESFTVKGQCFSLGEKLVVISLATGNSLVGKSNQAKPLSELWLAN